MIKFTFAVTVTAETAEQAARIIRDRVYNADEVYEFPYDVDYALLPIAIDDQEVES